MGDNFWKEASLKIDGLLKNPVKLKNEDLLIEQLEDISSISFTKQISCNYKSKFSSFNNKYTNYKPLFMTVLKNSQNILVHNRMRIGRSPSPMPKIKPFYEKRIKLPNILEIYGKRAGFSFLPGSTSPSKIKKFILELYEKYSLLHQNLAETDGNIRLEGIMDYLVKQGKMKKTIPRNKTPTPRLASSKISKKNHRYIHHETGHANYIQEHAQEILVKII